MSAWDLFTRAHIPAPRVTRFTFLTALQPSGKPASEIVHWHKDRQVTVSTLMRYGWRLNKSFSQFSPTAVPRGRVRWQVYLSREELRSATKALTFQTDRQKMIWCCDSPRHRLIWGQIRSKKKKDQTQTECYFELLNYSQRFLFGQHRAEHENKLILFVFQELCFIIYQLLNERDMTTQRGVHKNNEETKAISQQSVIGNGYYSHKNLNIKTRYWPQKNMHSIRSQSAYEQTVIKLKTEMSIF